MWFKRRPAQGEFDDLIPGSLEIVRYAKVNRDRVAEMTPEELQYQLQYWTKLLHNAKSVLELLDITQSLSHKFSPAPEVAWRFDYR